MKIFTFLLAVCFSIAAQAQITFLTEDKPIDMRNGYGYTHTVDGFAVQNGKYYFMTPNAKFFESRGTEKTTRLVKQFNFENEPWRITATNKYIYYTVYDGSKARLNRSNIATGVHEEVKYEGKPILFGSGFDAIIVKEGKTGIIIRIIGTTPSVTIIYSIDDDDTEAHYVTGELWGNQSIRTLGYFSDAANLGKEIFTNGSDSNSTNTIASYDPSNNDYRLKAFYALRKQGIFIKSGFIKFNNGLYILALEKNKKTAGIVNVMLLQLKSDTTMDLVSKFETTAIKEAGNGTHMLKAELVNDQLYVQCGPELWRYHAGNASFEKILTKPRNNWFEISRGQYIQQCSNFLVYSGEEKETDINVKNLATGEVVKLRTPVKAYESNNRFKGLNPVYVTNKYIYFFSLDTDGKESFTRYDPETATYTTIGFPELKKQAFRAIHCVSFYKDTFIFYAEYLGKKNTSYNIFMYKD